MSDYGHRIVKYLCGEHVESQCRCMMQNKPVIIGTTPCPTCAKQNPPTASELLDLMKPSRNIRDAAYNAEELASRVEAVLALCEFAALETGGSGLVSVAQLRRTLDGGKP